MHMTNQDRLLNRLTQAGFSKDLVQASLPDWWTAADAESLSGRTFVSLLLARRLSLDPSSLLDDNVPVGFLHTGPTKFKHLRLGPGLQREALTAYSQGVARLVLAARQEVDSRPVPSASDLRRSLLAAGSELVQFGDVLAACWGLGVPVLHLRLFPAATKGLTAMTVRLGTEHVILVARESGIPAQYMFHVAHELGHIALGHLEHTTAIIDADSHDEDAAHSLVDDEEEIAADEFAQILLTGHKAFRIERSALVDATGKLGTARELAAQAIAVGLNEHIDPGHVIMCFAETTGEWALAQAAAKHLPHQDEKPGTLVNKIFWAQMGELSENQSVDFLRAVAPV